MIHRTSKPMKQPIVYALEYDNKKEGILILNRFLF